MFETSFNGIRYCFYDDHLTINDAILRYELLDNIQHRNGDSPAFLFDYNGRRFAMPYPAEQLAQILPYMKLASQTVPQPDPVEIVSIENISVDPSPVQSQPSTVQTEPIVVEPEPVILEPSSSRTVPQDPPASPDMPKKAGKKKGCLVFVAIIVLLLIALFACVGGGDDSGGSDTDTTATDEYIEPETTEATTAEPNPLDDLSVEERNAYEKALQYIAYSGFSRSDLIGQLEYNQYSSEAAEKAVSLIEEQGLVDWNDECLEKAKDYMAYSSFSRQELIDQLKYNGFTDDQINSIIDEAYQ